MARKFSGRWNIPQNALPENRVCFCISIPDDPEHFAIFWGMLDVLSLPTSWEQLGAISPSVISNYYLGVNAANRACFEESLDMATRGCGCDFPLRERVDSGGQYQVSFDNGETWENNAGDPRHTSTIFPPPLWLLTGEDNSCNGASSAVAALRTITEQFCLGPAIDSISVAIEVLTTIISAFLGPIGTIITQLIGGVAILIIQTGQAAICSSITDSHYEDLLCILMCHISPDATFTEAGWKGVLNDVSEQFSGNPEFWFWNVINLLGASGLSNAARLEVIGAVDCDDCNCEPCGVEGIYYVISDAPLTYAKAEEVSPNVVRLFSYVPNAVPNGQFISWKFGSPAQGDNCCRTLGYQNLLPPASELSQAHEITCTNTDAPHLWPWLGVPVCGHGGYLTGFNIAPYSIDLRLDPDTACP